MTGAYPNDADGNALRRVERDGSDMSKPMFINFHVVVPNESTAEAVAAEARKLGYQTDVFDLDDDATWICECSTRMLATYDAVRAIGQELNELSGPFGGHCEGWGTFGNRSLGQSESA